MGVIYKILKQQRSMDLSLSSATRCKVQAAIKQRQQQRRLEDHLIQEQDQNQNQEQDQVHQLMDKDKEELAEQQLQQLCRFLAENAARKKRQRFKLQYQCQMAAHQDNDQEDQDQEQVKESFPSPPHDMDLEFIEQLQQTSPANSTLSVPAPRDSILLKIRHQIFERKRQRQRQLAELVQQRLVVWRPW
ncbi:PAX-interacting protein 1 [Drosophila eugracilis]|uniref:PAX-interacting protein 1 n=1 Tax=Drosophila eugracilis TaxID=29029 RepID=UPI0007E84565|nr:PAX-interacting protein 1 [Drosophila eugracilis]